MGAEALFLCVLLSFSAVSLRPAYAENKKDPGLVMNFYKDTCPQAEDIIREQVKLLYKRHKNTAFSWLRNIFYDCAGQSCDASLLPDSTRSSLSEKEADRSFGTRNFSYIESIKEAVERECPGVVSCADIVMLSTRDAIVALGGPYIPLKTGRRDGRKSRADVPEKYLRDHDESTSVVPGRFKAIGIGTPGVAALIRAHTVGRTHCVKLVHRLYPEVDPALNLDHVKHMLHKCPDPIPDPKPVQNARNDLSSPVKMDNTYYRNILAYKGLEVVDHQLSLDKRTKPYVKQTGRSQDYFKEFSIALTLLSENNPLTGTKGEIRKVCYLANKHH